MNWWLIGLGAVLVLIGKGLIGSGDSGTITGNFITFHKGTPGAGGALGWVLGVGLIALGMFMIWKGAMP